MIKKLPVGVLEMVAFISGFTLMAFELVAARILAPSIGSSTYVWTSVIGTIIAALSVGYYFGGKVADRRSQISDIAWLCIFAAGSIMGTLVFYEPVLHLTVTYITDPRLQGIVASLVLFVPASFIFGVISPYLVKLKVTSLAHAGSSVASLSALNSIGGISGTFVTGFLLFSYVGSRESLVLFVAVLLILAVCIASPKSQRHLKVIVSTLILLTSLVSIGSAGAISVDTPSAHYEITESVMNGSEVRLLSSGPKGAQSGIQLNGSNDLVFWYTRQIAEAIDQTTDRDTMLVLGGGTFTLPVYLAEKYPNTHIDVVEIDPDLSDIARNYFGYNDPGNVRLIFEDARTYVNQSQKMYDIIVVDVYSDTSIPFALTTEEYAKNVAGLLNTNGVLFANVIGSPEGKCKQLTGAVNASYRRSLEYAYYVKNPAIRALDARSNMIIAYARSELSLKNFIPLNIPTTVTLTDNFAPIEKIQANCL